jgi:hypothetical protein
MTEADEMVELILIQNVQLLPREDEVVWRWTSHGAYTVKSASLLLVNRSWSGDGLPMKPILPSLPRFC